MDCTTFCEMFKAHDYVLEYLSYVLLVFNCTVVAQCSLKKHLLTSFILRLK